MLLNEHDVVQTEETALLLQAGFSPECINVWMKAGSDEKKRMMRKQRCRLMCEIHEFQRKLDCLDYWMYRMKTDQCEKDRHGGENMERMEACEKKFAELFGGKPNSGEGNDPELMQILQRFIFGEVSYTGSLDDRMREMITCVVLATYQTLPQLKAHANAALNVGVTPTELREIIYGCMPFIGCPKTLCAIGIVDEVLQSRGIALPLENAATVTEENRMEKGKAIQMPIYGDEIRENMRDLPAPFAKALPDFLTGYCFGDFYTRKGLDVKTRELLSLVVLVALGGCETQLRPHVAGCLKTGNTEEDVYTALVHAMPYTGIPRAFNAIYAVKAVLAK